MRVLQQAGIAAGPVETLKDMLESDPHLSSEHYQQVRHPSGYVFTTHRLPIRVNGRPAPVSAHPSMGADNPYVFGELLGMSSTEIAALTAEGVLA
jgi:crotonobetainyl-CoA:carnitine CoA-transferase CaiB-like acyl-CoA transferase